MSRYVFDIETNGLLLDAKTMYVLVAHNLDTGEVTHYLEGDLGWKEKFDEASELIGHNIIGYDLAVLKKLFNFVPKAKLIDYTDSHNNRIFIPMSLIVHFYDAAKFEHERKRKDISWNDFCNSLFESDT